MLSPTSRISNEIQVMGFRSINEKSISLILVEIFIHLVIIV